MTTTSIRPSLPPRNGFPMLALVVGLTPITGAMVMKADQLSLSLPCTMSLPLMVPLAPLDRSII